MEIKEPQCPYCYNGVIVKTEKVKNLFFCCNCQRIVDIKRFKEEPGPIIEILDQNKKT